MTYLRRLPIRTRLAIVTAGLTFVVLLLFAVVLGLLAADQVRSSFDDDLQRTAADLQERVPVKTSTEPLIFGGGFDTTFTVPDEVLEAASSGDAVLRVVAIDGSVIRQNRAAADLGPPVPGLHDSGRYRVETRALFQPGGGVAAYLQYAKPRSNVTHTIARIRLFLALGVVGGTVLAFLIGLALARRALAPVTNLARAAREIERTRDPGSVTLPKPSANDEVADLARTLEDMLRSLDAAQQETEAALGRQRQFVADASHELRTPLTSILANLELLENQLHGENAMTAAAALRSSKRMRRLVGDLLLLARADAGREGLPEHVRLADIVREAAGEAAPVSADHELLIELPEIGPTVNGVSDDLHRLAVNLIENALVHTPPGTRVTVRVEEAGGQAVLEVEDAGPGIAAGARERIFDRFVRGSGDTGGGSGLGLAIVKAVAERHGGTVEVGEGAAPPFGGLPRGARFTVRLPAESTYPPPQAGERVEPEAELTPPPPPATPSAGV
jgi:signal transduction histidine kinase